VARTVTSELAALGDGTAGRLAVIAAATDQPGLAAALTAALRNLPSAGERLAVLTPVQSKGLEFDAVVLVEPAAILAGSLRGASDLYVAMSRATQRLRILYRQPLPSALAGLPAPDRAGTS
jgi:superfamily I DNA/RNA helicase